MIQAGGMLVCVGISHAAMSSIAGCGGELLSQMKRLYKNRHYRWRLARGMLLKSK